MNGFAALTVNEAAVASGHGAGLLPAIAPSALDGFAVGALLSALCVLLVMVPRHISRRSRQSARTSGWANVPHPPVTPYLSAALTAASAQLAAPAAASPFADESAEIVVRYPVREDTGQLSERSLPSPAGSFPSSEVRSAGRRSKHRQAEAARLDRPERQDRLPEARRGAGRHAAPSIGAGSRMASRRTLDPLASRD
jgi:hypothetical protein